LPEADVRLGHEHLGGVGLHLFANNVGLAVDQAHDAEERGETAHAGNRNAEQLWPLHCAVVPSLEPTAASRLPPICNPIVHVWLTNAATRHAPGAALRPAVKIAQTLVSRAPHQPARRANQIVCGNTIRAPAASAMP